MRTTLLVPTKNELLGMKEIMPRVKREWVDEILVVDGGDDGSFEYAQQQNYKTIRQESPGLVGAYIDGLKAATGDVIITFSPDGNSIPELIPDVVRKMREGYDMVIVSRYLEGAKSEDDDWITGFGNWMFTAIINLFFRANYTDSLVMFRVWKKDVLRFSKSPPPLRAGFEPHLSILCAKHRLRTAEIPGDEPPRCHGIRKMNPLLNGSAVVWLILREFFRR